MLCSILRRQRRCDKPDLHQDSTLAPPKDVFPQVVEGDQRPGRVVSPARVPQQTQKSNENERYAGLKRAMQLTDASRGAATTKVVVVIGGWTYTGRSSQLPKQMQRKDCCCKAYSSASVPTDADSRLAPAIATAHGHPVPDAGSSQEVHGNIGLVMREIRLQQCEQKLGVDCRTYARLAEQLPDLAGGVLTAYGIPPT